jgi:hypothetical protein
MKRDDITEAIKELHKRFWNGSSFLTEDAYNSEIKRLRFKWITDYDI